MPPDNNLAERMLRLALTKRKVSGGSRKGGAIQTYCQFIRPVLKTNIVKKLNRNQKLRA